MADSTDASLSPRRLRRELQRRLQEHTGYHAFISHAHDPDAGVAQKIERKLEGWARPVRGGRTMRVFRDTSKMSASPGLRSAILEALDISDWLIVLLSPAAAGSDWVRAEVEYWREKKDVHRILLVHTGGNLAWDHSTSDFSADSDCVPPALRGAFEEEPRHVDFTGLAEQRWSVRRSRLHTGIRDLATRILDVPADALEGAHRSTVRATNAGVVGLAVLMIAAIGFWMLAQSQSILADEEAALGRASNAANRALDLYDDDIDVGLLLALEAWTYRDTAETRAALATGLLRHRHLEQVLRFAESPHRVAVSPDESRLAVFTLDQQLEVWDMEAGTLVSEAFVGFLVEEMAFDPTGHRLAILSASFDSTPNQLEVRSVSDLGTVVATTDLGGEPLTIAFAGSMPVIAFPSGVVAMTTDGSTSPLLDRPISAMAVDSRGTLAIGTENETEFLVQLYELSSGSAEGLLEAVIAQPVTAVGLSPDGQRVAFATSTTVGIWERSEGWLVSSDPGINGAVTVVPSPDSLGAVALLPDGEVLTWTALTGEVTGYAVTGKSLLAPPATGAHGRRVASIGDRLVSIWRSDRPFPIAHQVTEANLIRYEGAPLIRHLEFSPDGGSLLVVEPSGMWIRSTDDWRVIDGIEQHGICAASISGDGTTLWSIEIGPPAELRRRPIDNLSQVMDAVSVPVEACESGLDVSREGDLYAINGELYDTAGEVVSSDGISSIDNALSNDASLLSWTSSGEAEGRPLIRTLDVASGDVTEFQVGQTLWGIAHGPAGLLAAGVVRGEDEGTITVWNERRQVILSLPRPHLGTREPAGEDPVAALAFAPDGRHLVAGGMLGTLTVWQIDPELLAATACRVVNRAISETELDDLFSEDSLGFAVVNACSRGE